MQLTHTALYVRDLEAMKGFYVRYFGAQANQKYHNPKTGLQTYFLSFSSGARLELMTRPGLAEGEGNAPHTGYAHLAFALGSRTAVDALTDHLRADGYAVVNGPRVTGDSYYESCVLGPEGCVLELTE